MNDITLSYVHDLNWADYQAYAVSLNHTGYAGMKVLFITPDTKPDVRENFLGLGFTLAEGHAPPVNPIQWNEGGWLRFRDAVKFLRSSGRFRYALWTDARDVIFQSNPFTWLENNLSIRKRLVIAGLGHAIKDCPQYNDPWVKASAGSDYARIREFEAITTGTIGGDADLVCSLFEDIYDGCCSRPSTVQLPHPQGVTDQGELNVVARNASYADVMRIPRPEEGFTAQWWPGKSSWPEVFKHEGLPRFDSSDGTIYVPGTNTPFSIVHLYDRDPLWVTIMRDKYK
jgi:hypothetical protein